MENETLNSIKEKKAIKALEEGKILFEKCKIKKAFSKFNEAIKLNPTLSEAYLEKGEAHMGMFESSEAEECLLKYIELAGENERVYKALIEVYDQKSDFELAVDYCDKLTNLKPNDWEIFYLKADLLILVGDYETALDVFNKCIELNPKFYKAICGKALCLYTLDNDDEAIKTYEHAIEVDKSESHAYMELGLIYRDMGVIVKALKYLKKAYDLSPDDELYKSQYIITKDCYN
ncbi:tetratricopeptide repeat protein [Clostridium grantii]|uniref:TPR repeat-containing protein n=1 Tax=Clostridium grantii DSM 8605 TaxID=1121316 RepID=A0A1M5WTX4_9CLOT|nr:tetratricopeptide repeat protein [Clostridium grantii]SHH91056.1 TPR repeat-containing protein [Clostridium grantii DSM 8605]